MFETLSHRYGWTPDQIRNMDHRDVYDYWDIMVMRNRIENAEAKKAQTKSRYGRH